MMPRKVPPDRSKFLLSPMPGLLAEVAVKAGPGGEGRRAAVVIEAMKMQNVLIAERDGTVAELLAKQAKASRSIRRS